MNSKLPHSEYVWCDEGELQTMEYIIRSYDENSDTGYVIESDLHYPPKYFARDSELPLLVSKRVVEISELSPLQIAKLNEYGIQHCSTPRIIMDLNDKKRYICDIQSLKFYLEQGIEIKKIRRRQLLIN